MEGFNRNQWKVWGGIRTVEAAEANLPRVFNWLMLNGPKLANWAAANWEKSIDALGALKGQIVDAHNAKVVQLAPEKYRKQVARSFKGWINRITLKYDLVVYRYTGDTSSKTGYYYTTNGDYTPEEARQELALPDGNTATNVTAYVIPAGTTILVGQVAPMAGEEGYGDYATGGGTQVYVSDPSVLEPL